MTYIVNTEKSKVIDLILSELNSVDHHRVTSSYELEKDICLKNDIPSKEYVATFQYLISKGLINDSIRFDGGGFAVHTTNRGREILFEHGSYSRYLKSQQKSAQREKRKTFLEIMSFVVGVLGTIYASISGYQSSQKDIEIAKLKKLVSEQDSLIKHSNSIDTTAN